MTTSEKEGLKEDCLLATPGCEVQSGRRSSGAKILGFTLTLTYINDDERKQVAMWR